MVKNRNELLSDINAFIGDRTDDESIELIENITDTFEDLETKASNETKWKEKYEQNDAEWRKKYRERFSTSKEPEDDVIIDDGEKDTTPKTFDDLFKNKED